MTGRSVRIVRSADRFLTERNGVSTTHEFSFGDHYDPDRIRFGPLVAHNVETLSPGSGYEPHVHRDVEIVTWVQSGTLDHDDDHRHRARIEAGTVQRLTAGAGVKHSERNAEAGPAGAPATFVQLWLDCPADLASGGVTPEYETGVVTRGPSPGHLLAVAASRDTGVTAPVVSLRCPGVTLLVADLQTGDTRSLPDARMLHVHVMSGAVRLRTGEALWARDSAAITGPRAEHLVAEAATSLLALAMDA